MAWVKAGWSGLGQDGVGWSVIMGEAGKSLEERVRLEADAAMRG